MKIKLIFFVAFCLVIQACGPKKEATKTVETTQVAQPESALNDLVVSFNSKASGIDVQCREKLDEFINMNPKIISEKYKWGREGETSYCIRIRGSEKERGFISEEIKTLLKDCINVNINEKAECVYKR